MTFFQQLGSLVSSGTPLLQAIQVAAEQNQSDRLQAILAEVAARVAAGVPFHQALANTSGSSTPIGSPSSAPAKSPGKCSRS